MDKAKVLFRGSKLCMGTFALVCLALFLLPAGCRNNEEPKVRTPGPSAPIFAENRLKQLRDAANQNPGDVSAWINLGNASMDNHLYQDAIDAYQKALDLDPKDVNVRVDMGTCFRNIGKFDRAIEEYRKAIRIDPRHLNAHRNLGIVLGFDLGRREDAIKELQTSLTLAPSGPVADNIRKAIEELRRRQMIK